MTEADPSDALRRFRSDDVRRQITVLLTAWGMAPEHVRTTAAALVDADLHGIDTHGLSMLPSYDRRRREGLVTIDATVQVVTETPASAVVDGGGGLGHVPSVRAVELASDKARTVGLAAVTVRNSNHFGAAGYYTRMLAAAGLVGMATTNVAGPRMAPTFGREARLSTNALAFAAPAARHAPFSLDMSTTTVSAGRIRNRATEDRDLPEGWAADRDGQPITDPHVYERDSRDGATMAPLGGTPEGASHKGYGLAAMVEILSVGLSGATLVTRRDRAPLPEGSSDLGHFFLAIDPTIFRAPGDLEATVDDLIDDLHATTPIDPEQPVMVAGEPEEQIRADRERRGIPVAPGLRRQIRHLTTEADAPFVLE